MILIMRGANYYKDLSYEERKKILSLIFKKAIEIVRLDGKLNYNKLSRIIFTETGVTINPNTIRRWFRGQRNPFRRVGDCRRVEGSPPDDNGQVVRGLLLTDVHRYDGKYSLWLALSTTKDFFAHSLQKFFSRYGWVNVTPRLYGKSAEWDVRVSLNREAWIYELEKPFHELTTYEKLKLLSGVVSGDGWITLYHFSTRPELLGFRLAIGTSDPWKAILYGEILASLSIPTIFVRTYNKRRKAIYEDQIIETKTPYSYAVAVVSRKYLEYLLTNLRLLQPFREVKRILALRFMKKGIGDIDLIKPVWDYLRALEKAATIRSRIRAYERIPDEKFIEKGINKERIVDRLRKRLYENLEIVRELEPLATKIISTLRVITG